MFWICNQQLFLVFHVALKNLYQMLSCIVFFAAMPRSLVTHYNIYMARLGLRSRLCRLVFFLVDLNMVIFDGVYLLGKMRWLYQTILFVGMASKKECQTWLILGYTYPPKNQLGSWEDEFPGSQWWDILFVPWRVVFFFFFRKFCLAMFASQLVPKGS